MLSWKLLSLKRIVISSCYLSSLFLTTNPHKQLHISQSKQKKETLQRLFFATFENDLIFFKRTTA